MRGNVVLGMRIFMFFLASAFCVFAAVEQGVVSATSPASDLATQDFEPSNLLTDEVSVSDSGPALAVPNLGGFSSGSYVGAGFNTVIQLSSGLFGGRYVNDALSNDSTYALIVSDETAPGCFGYEGVDKNCHSLFANVVDGESLVYSVDGVQPGKTYTVSFMYKAVNAGSFIFTVKELDAVDSGILGASSWSLFFDTFTVPEDEESASLTLKFAADANSQFYLDELQLVEAPEYTVFNNFRYEAGCCPFDYCWTGGIIKAHPECIHDDFYERNVSMPPLGWEGFDTSISSFLDAPAGFRCINGSWEFSRVKFSPFFDDAGFCPVDSQCFIGRESDLAEDACVDNATIASDKIPDSEINEYFFCYEGNWTTTTKEIALQLLEIAETDPSEPYTLFCDSYDKALNSERDGLYRDFMGDNAVSLLASDYYVNEFCVLDFDGQVIAGVSLNQDIDYVPGVCDEEDEDCNPDCVTCDPTLDGENCDENLCFIISPDSVQESFIEVLKGPDGADYCDSVVDNEEYLDGRYHACDDNDVYYNPALKTVLFSKPTRSINTFSLPDAEKTFIQEVFEYLKEVIDDILVIVGIAAPASDEDVLDQLDFVRTAGSFDKLYLSYSPDGPNVNTRTIKAIRETRANVVDGDIDYTTFISAEYSNYQVDICRFFEKHIYLTDQISGKKADALEPESNNMACTPFVVLDDDGNPDGWIHSIYVEDPILDYIDTDIWSGKSDNFWNDITAKIRNQPAKDFIVSAVDVPAFSWTPASPVAGADTYFNITESSDAVARTWFFGDGAVSSSKYGTTAKHTYDAAKKHDVVLCVMNPDFNISCSSPIPVDVGAGPSVEIVEQEQSEEELEDRKITVEFRISGGTPPYTLNVDWNDSSEPDSTTSATCKSDVFTCDKEVFTASHQYDFDSANDQDTFMIKASGIDGSGVGVEYYAEKVISVSKQKEESGSSGGFRSIEELGIDDKKRSSDDSTQGGTIFSRSPSASLGSGSGKDS